jgi:hypothetical protein
MGAPAGAPEWNKRGLDSQQSTLVQGGEEEEQAAVVEKKEGRARKRRKYDSGLGFMEEEEFEGVSVVSE